MAKEKVVKKKVVVALRNFAEDAKNAMIKALAG